MNRVFVLLLLSTACGADGAASLAGAPASVRSAPDPFPPTIGLCCVSEDVCTMPLVGQEACPTGSSNRMCEPIRAEGDIGPLWKCRESSPGDAENRHFDVGDREIIGGTASAQGAGQ